MSADQPLLEHHFEDLGQQHEAATLGMWVFLATELMFFGGLFLAYTLFRWQYPEAFEFGSDKLSVILGGINTVVLLTSSLTMALAVHAAHAGNRRPLLLCLALTMALGLVFLCIKATEYYIDYEEKLIPGTKEFLEGDTLPEGVRPQHVGAFMWIYFVMTGVHALHMIVGISCLTVVLILAKRGRFPPRRYFPVEVMGLYWHFVDIIWIFLFPLLYLIGELHELK